MEGPLNYRTPWQKAGMTYEQWEAWRKVAHGIKLTPTEQITTDHSKLSREEAVKLVLEHEPKS